MHLQIVVFERVEILKNGPYFNFPIQTQIELQINFSEFTPNVVSGVFYRTNINNKAPYHITSKIMLCFRKFFYVYVIMGIKRSRCFEYNQYKIIFGIDKTISSLTYQIDWNIIKRLWQNAKLIFNIKQGTIICWILIYCHIEFCNLTICLSAIQPRLQL